MFYDLSPCTIPDVPNGRADLGSAFCAEAHCSFNSSGSEHVEHPQQGDWSRRIERMPWRTRRVKARSTIKRTMSNSTINTTLCLTAASHKVHECVHKLTILYKHRQNQIIPPKTMPFPSEQAMSASKNNSTDPKCKSPGKQNRAPFELYKGDRAVIRADGTFLQKTA